MNHIGYSIALFPFDWTLGRFQVRQKTLYAFGPLRFCVHRVKGTLEEYAA